MPQFIYRIHPTRADMLSSGPTEREARVVGEHFEYLKGLTAAGHVHMAGRTLTTDERTFGIVVFSAPSETAAKEMVAHDPAVHHGVMRAELWPFQVALWSAGGPMEAAEDA
jgi:uncharacterized protein